VYKHKNRMAFIVIEGLDGAGKSTQLKLLAEHYEGKGIKSHYLHFPRTDSPFFGELIARFLRGEFGKVDQVDPYIIALLYAGDRRDAANQIREWLQAGHTVLLDRYVYSNIAFQCGKQSDKAKQLELREWILKLEYDYFGIPKPDLNLFLDVPFEFTKSKLTSERQGADRDYLKGSVDIHEENLTFQEKVRQVYLMQEQLDPSFSVISCTDSDGNMKPPADIFKLIIDKIIYFAGK